jgi:hypothetical protein
MRHAYSMRKLAIAVAVLGLGVGLVMGEANGAVPVAPKVGAPCAKVGRIVGTLPVKYVCKKEGTKMVWRRWNAGPSQNKVVNKDNLSTPTPLATQVVFKPLFPITLPVTQNGTITFANAASRFDGIPQIAWQRVQDVIAANSEVNIPTTIHIGPHTQTTVEQILPLLQREYRLFQGFSQPSSYMGLTYNGQDEPWAEKELQILLGDSINADLTSHYVDVMRQACDLSNPANPSCTSGNSLDLSPTTNGASLYGVQEPFWNLVNQNVGPMSQVNHEYTHNVQFAQWIGAPRKPGSHSGIEEAHTKMPCWFQEGQANGIGIAVWALDLPTYINARRGNVARAINPNGPKPSLATYSADSFTKFLYDQDPLTCYQPSSGDYQLGYSVGYAATEALIAIGGPQSTMALLTRMAAGDNWSSAFQAVYGISWEQGAVVLGEVLAAEYAVLPLGSG